jgi:NAD(P)-dependent dehydrogenase (short-subunit alcohol dehydrogenase family)
MALLAGKTAVITGGSSGIGLATARRFVEEGATVFIFSRRPTELEAAVATLGPAATAVYGDVTGSADLQKLRAIVAATGKGADIIFANTGIAGAAALGEISHAHFDSLFEINVKGVVLTVQTLLPVLNAGASIILTASVAADRGRIGASVHAATNAALRSFARTWANELAYRNIRVNTVNPAFTETPGLNELVDNDAAASMEQLKILRSQEIPLGRLAQADEVANAVVFLASDLSSFTTGAALPVDGGYSQI